MDTQKNSQLDSLDKSILLALVRDARLSFVQLAKELRISNSLVHQRVKKLKDIGAVDNATFKVNPKVLGYDTSAYSRIIVTEARFIPKIIAALKNIPEVIECNNVTGKYALIIKILAYDNDHLREVLYNKVHTIKWVEGTDTIIVFETAFQRNVPF